ncbi:hypothetical protein Agabi119p4_6196 [Agaricus bisporus var. burnettii]|uniref:Uncharacterized protein n=1 Tax=Agaricus bisporus var. burnettii TaxID=192524 RepID=A0A8H7CAU9_AGABI|nr:hypothetical protein Agabi119p4_6196 [Agaricus bisporus var. burnettii]
MMLARLLTASRMKPYYIPRAVRFMTVPHGQQEGRRIEGENNTKKYHDPKSTSPSSVHAEYDPKRSFKFPVDPKSNPEDQAPYEDTSGDYNRSGMRTTEYSHVDKKEPYSPTGGEHRYGGTKSYEWNAERLEKESAKGGKSA